MQPLQALAHDHTQLDDADLAWLQLLQADWQILADLSFADLLLYVPEKEVPPKPCRFVVLAQMRPTTSQTLYREDQLGLVVDEEERPLVARAWRLGQIIDGDVPASPRG